jgi:hypothetical protein
MVRSCDLIKSPYNTFYSLGKHDALARTVKDAGKIGSGSRPDSGPTYMQVPRCVMFENGKEDNYVSKILECPENIDKKIDDEGKKKILGKLVGPDAAESGVMFSSRYRDYFSDKIEPQIYELQRINYRKLEIHFSVSGIIQKCGASTAFSNIFQMVRLDQNAILSTFYSGDQNKMDVKINGNLFSAALFLGMISPDPAGSILRTPRIFHGIDMGLGFSPHNSVVDVVNDRPIDLPMGMYMYTMNIDEISDPVVLGLGAKIQDRIARSFLSASSPIRELTNKFISSI